MERIIERIGILILSFTGGFFIISSFIYIADNEKWFTRLSVGLILIALSNILNNLIKLVDK